MSRETIPIQVYETINLDNMLVRKEDLLWKEPSQSANRIQIKAEQVFQEIDGFGASFTDSSAYLVNEVLDELSKEQVMQRLFSKEQGIELSFIRQPMGASDYALTIYSYQDTPNHQDDFAFQYFTIDHDKQNIIPLLKRMLEINPLVKIMATPWSAPAWMKTNREMCGGQLREECYEAFSDYFVNFIQEYAKQGIQIYALTPQNEPMYEPKHYPSMRFEAKAEAQFIKNQLGPNLRKHEIQTKILCYDHNWDLPEYPLEVLKEASEYVDGVAWHVYAASPEAQMTVWEQFQEKEVFYTEASGGEWIAPFDHALTSMMETNIGTLRNYAKTLVLWNIALDEQNGPTVPGFGKSTCRGLITINQQTKEITYNLDYYVLAHFSKFVKQGARRIASNEIAGISNVAFCNPDGSFAMILNNSTRINQEIQVMFQGKSCSYRMQARSALTLFWK